MEPSGAAHATVKRELLVRWLDTTVPALMHGGFSYAEGYAGVSARREPSAVAALRVFGEFTDMLGGHRLTVVLAAGDRHDAVAERMARLRTELSLPPQVRVDVVPGGCDDALVPALRRAGAVNTPVLAYLDSVGRAPPGHDTVAQLSAGRRADLLVALDPAALTAPAEAMAAPAGSVAAAAEGPDPADGDRVFGDPGWRAAVDLPAAERYPYLVTRYREALGRTGLDLVAHVELVDGRGAAQLLFFATASEKSLDRFKAALWAVDEFAGVRYRDPRDTDHALLDISLDPHLGPLRRALLDRVRATGRCPAADLRRYTRVETIYRAEDAFRALGGLVTTGKLSRWPERGRLTADTVLAPRG